MQTNRRVGVYSRIYILTSLQRLRDPALSARGPSPPEPLPEHVLRRRDLLDGRLRRLRARHLALPALHGHHDMRRPHSPAHTSEYNLYLFYLFI